MEGQKLTQGKLKILDNNNQCDQIFESSRQQFSCKSSPNIRLLRKHDLQIKSAVSTFSKNGLLFIPIFGHTVPIQCTSKPEFM